MLNCQSSIDTEITMFSFSNSCLVILLLGVLVLTPPVDGWGVSTVICTGTYKHQKTGIAFFSYLVMYSLLFNLFNNAF